MTQSLHIQMFVPKHNFSAQDLDTFEKDLSAFSEPGFNLLNLIARAKQLFDTIVFLETEEAIKKMHEMSFMQQQPGFQGSILNLLQSSNSAFITRGRTALAYLDAYLKSKNIGIS